MYNWREQNEMLKIVAIKFPVLSCRSVSRGKISREMDECVVSLGDNGVVAIEEHLPYGDGDVYFIRVIFDDETSEDFFNVNWIKRVPISKT